MKKRFDGFELLINIWDISYPLIEHPRKKGKVSDVAEMQMQFASKSLTPPRMRWFQIAQIEG